MLVIGVGNELLGDEGFGIHVARALLARREQLSPSVDVIDAGTALFDLGSEIPLYDRVIIIDAIRSEGAPGTAYRVDDAGTELTDPDDSPLALSLHDWNAVDMLRGLKAMGLRLPPISLIGAEPHDVAPGLGLSPDLRRAAARIVSLLIDELSCSGPVASGDLHVS